MEVQGGQLEPSVDEYPSLPGKRVEVEVSDSSGYRYDRSFVNVLRMTAGGVKSMSSCLLNFFLVSECFEAELGGVEQRIAMDCYAMEAKQISSKELVVVPSLASLSLAAVEWVGEVSFRVIWAEWAACWVGFEAQRFVDQGGSWVGSQVGSRFGSGSWSGSCC